MDGDVGPGGAVDIARGACRWWSGQGRPFHVLVVDTDPLSGLAAL